MDRKKYFIAVVFVILFFSNKMMFADSIDVKVPCPTINITGTNVSCFGDNDGSATLTVNGGTGNFTITWSTGATNVYSISNLIAGIYDVKVKDNGTGCVVFDLITITEPDRLTTALTVEDVSCYGESTGSITMDIQGGTLPYSVLWSNSVTSQDNNNIPEGTYTVYVSDGHNCTARDTATVSQPAQALGASYVVTEIGCNNESNGAIDVDVWGGTPPYAYNWNGNAYNSQDLSEIPAGTYSLLITDRLDCPKNLTVQLVNPPLLQMTNTVVDNQCFGAYEGSINLSVTGGTGDYTYEWANSELLLSYDTPFIDELPNETYNVVVTDEHECEITGEFEIESPSEIIVTIVGTDVTFFGGSNGQIDLTVTGGTPPYSFSWSNGVATEDNNDIPAGFYEVFITDANDCSAYASITITEPLEPLGFTYTTKSVSCNGGDDGEIYAYATGGTQPYRYLWSTGDTLSYVVDLFSGNYILTLFDANDIEFADTVAVSQPDPFTFSYENTQPTCFGFSNGQIDLTVNGGTPPYSFEWYDEDFALAGLEQDLSYITAGSYTVVLEDSLKCLGEYSVDIGQPDELILTTTKENVRCYNQKDGKIYSEVEGGTVQYSYLWSNGEITPNIENLVPGTYTITVTDAQRCEKSEAIVITQPDSLIIQLEPYRVSCENQSDGVVTSRVTGGNGGYLYDWSNSEITEDIEGLIEGNYTLSVVDILGCTAEQTTYVEKLDIACLVIPTTFSPNGDRINDTWEIYNIDLYPDCFVQVFSNWGRLVFSSKGYNPSWDGTSNGQLVPSGTYYYTISLQKTDTPYSGTVTIVK